MITTVLFDLDGTLLPMDQEVFLKSYMNALAAKMAHWGYDPKLLIKSVWQGTGTMVQNTGSHTNEEVFWETFSACYNREARSDEPIFLEFYEKEFQDVRLGCGFEPKAAVVINTLKEKGIRRVLATNPLFPSIATYSRIRWAGLQPEDFELITTYENSRRCKPNPDYYGDILETLHLRPEECVMVGNDVEEDMIAETLGMQVFLLTDCLINRNNMDISRYRHGNFDALLDYIGGLNL